MCTNSDKLNFHEATYLSRLSHKERRLLVEMLQKTQPLETKQVAKFLGLSNMNSVRVAMHRVRARLRGTGWTVTTNTGGPATNTGVYQLEIEAHDA